MASGCNYHGTGYTGHELNNFCYYAKNGAELFARNLFNASWGLENSGQQSQLQAINEAVGKCLNPHINQAMSQDLGGFNDPNPLLNTTVICPGPGTLYTNTQMGDGYTVEYSAGITCNGNVPEAAVNSTVTFDGDDSLCLEGDIIRKITGELSAEGVTGILDAALQKCIGLVSEAVEFLRALPVREVVYDQSEQCKFLVNQTFSPSPSPSPSPNLSPFPSPSPSPFPSFSPFPSSSPSPFHSFSPFPSPAPSPSPDESHEGFHKWFWIIITLAVIVVVFAIRIGRYIYKKMNFSQVYTGTGRSLARENPDESNSSIQAPPSNVASSQTSELETFGRQNEEDPLLIQPPHTNTTHGATRSKPTAAEILGFDDSLFTDLQEDDNARTPPIGRPPVDNPYKKNTKKKVSRLCPGIDIPIVNEKFE